MTKCPVTGGVRLREVSVSGGSTVVNRAVSTNVFTKQEGRHYKHFVNFKRNRLANLDFSSVFKWINDHKKNVQLGIRAR